MMSLFPLLLVPLLVGGVAFATLKLTFSWKEFLLMEAVCVVVLVSGFFIARHSAMQATEHLNGHLTKKTEDSISCCHCRSVCDSTDKKGNCERSHEECSHSSDSEWNLHVSTGDTITVETCDGWGSPPVAWKNAAVGEFAVVEHSYTNYLKADPGTLLAHGADEHLLQKIPSFPEVHDLYRVSKVVTDGVKAPASWQPALEKLNDELGARKQIDIVFLLTKHRDPNAYASAVEAAWLYGPKNALTVVIGTDGTSITWARVVTLSRVELMKVELRDDLEGLALDDPKIFEVVKDQVVRHWARTAMSEFEYLAAHASPSTLGITLLYFLAFLLSGGLVMFMHGKDVFGDERWLNQQDRNRSRGTGRMF
jgi:hypothetical protein